MPELIKVFIGSTKEDLTDHRNAVRSAITELELFPDGMETWVVEDTTAVELCKQKIEEADIYIGIYAYRYGWQPPGHRGKSITELEYIWAGNRNLPRLCFVINDNHPWAETKKDHKTKEHLDRFKKKVKKQIAGFFSTPDNLKALVLGALQKELQKIRKTPPKSEIPCNLVPPPEYFAGRAAELEILKTALQGAKSVAIVAVKGMGGIGKTTLVRYFASTQEGFGLRLWAELGEQIHEDLLPSILRDWGRKLGNHEFPLEWNEDKLLDEMGKIVDAVARNDCKGNVLLVIDDVWEKTVDNARKLRSILPLGSHTLVTTRSEDVSAKLHCHNSPLNKMIPADGAALMSQLIEDPRIADCSTDLEKLSEVLDGHPLALTLAARQLRRNFLPRRIKEMADRLRKGIESGESFITLRLDTGDKKIDSVSVTLEQTLQALGGGDETHKAKRLSQFRALGVLPAVLSFRAAHIYTLWNEADSEALDDLVAEGLLTPDIARDDWYEQHALLRAYARALLREQDELEAVTEKHRDYLIGLAKSVFVDRRHHPETWGEITDDLPQIHALGNELTAEITGSNNPIEQDDQLNRLNGDCKAIANISNHTLEASEKFADCVSNYVVKRSEEDFEKLISKGAKISSIKYVTEEGKRWLITGLIAAYVRDSKEIEHSLASRIAILFNILTNKKESLNFLNYALNIQLEIGNKPSAATTLNNMGAVYDDIGDKLKALAYYQQALLLHLEVADKSGQATTLNNIGLVYWKSGENEKALAYYQQALLLHLEVANKSGQASTLNNIGGVYADLGDKQQALAYYQKTLPVFIEVQDPYGESITRFNIALILWGQGEHDEALTQIQIARDLNARIGISTDDEDYYSNLWRAQLGRSGDGEVNNGDK